MKITVISVCNNEEAIIPYYLNHYTSIADEIIVFDNDSSDRSREILEAHPKTEVIRFNTRNHYREDILVTLRNTAYRTLPSESDWFIIVDTDEFLWHADGVRPYLQRCLDQGITVPLVAGYNMVGSGMPEGSDDQLITDHIQTGIRDDDAYGKCVVTQKSVKMNYGLGSHRCNPEGQVVYSQKRELKLLHYAHYDLEYRLEKARMRQYSQHFIKHTPASFFDISYTRQNYYEMLDLALPVIGTDVSLFIAETTKAAEAGDKEAQYKLGMIYYFGHDVTADGDTAAEWLDKAAQQGHTRAQYRLTLCRYYSAEHGRSSHPELAKQWFEEAAKGGDSRAQHCLGKMLLTGDGGPIDAPQAIKWLTVAAEADYGAAQFDLGALYSNGKHVPVNVEEAIKWYDRAGKQYNNFALFNLAIIYYNGALVKQDLAKAYTYLRLAAKHGCGQAHEVLNAMAQNDLGVPQDKAGAIDWLMNKIGAQMGPT